MFKCDKCGICCKKLHMSPLYVELDRGDGICKFLNDNLCYIYETRPLLCRVDESYDAFFSSTMSKDEYYRLNYKSCNKFKNEGV